MSSEPQSRIEQIKQSDALAWIRQCRGLCDAPRRSVAVQWVVSQTKALLFMAETFSTTGRHFQPDNTNNKLKSFSNSYD